MPFQLVKTNLPARPVVMVVIEQMTAFGVLLIVVAGYATVWALYLLLIPLVASLRRSGQRDAFKPADREWPTIAVIVPARNAAQVVERCIRSLRTCNYPMGKLDTYVVADHCSDATAERAESAGATILTRNDGPTGKTYALAWALEALKERGITADLYVIVDATAQVEPNFLAAMAERWEQGEHIIANHTFVSSENQTWYARCLALMFVHRNLQNLTRDRIGLSAMLTGCGMAFSRKYIQQFGWSLALPSLSRGSHPTEDWRHAVRAVEQGYRVAFAEDARVATSLRGSLTEATQQGARWERGRIATAGTHAVKLLVQGFMRQSLVKVFAALDAIQPPVAILSAISLFVAVSSMVAPGTRLSGVAGLIPITLVGMYALVVVLRGRHEGITLTTAMWAPFYIAWRCITFFLAWGLLDRIDLSRRRKDAAEDLARNTPSLAPDGKSSPPSIPR